MQQVKAMRVDVLEKIKANAAEHETEVTEAIVGYRKEINLRLERIQKAIKNDEPITALINDLTNTPRPEDHRKEYRAIIATLELAEEDTILITQAEVQWYVLDEWPWRLHAGTQNALYSGTAFNKFGGANAADADDNF